MWIMREKRASLKDTLRKHWNYFKRGEDREIGFKGLNLVLKRGKMKS
jgi:hypothetical protein